MRNKLHIEDRLLCYSYIEKYETGNMYPVYYVFPLDREQLCIRTLFSHQIYFLICIPSKGLAARNKVPGITTDASLIMKRLAGRKGRKESIAFTHTNARTEDAHARAELTDDQFTDAQSVACIVAI